MINKEFEEAVKIISQHLSKNNIKWALIGSTNMALQGIEVNPRDLDIVVKLDDLKKMKQIFSDYNISEIRELKPLTKEPAWEVKIIIEKIEVQILGERNTGEYVRKLLLNRIINIKLGEIEVPCFTLEAEAQTYAETNREHKADIIKEFLKNKVNFI